MFALQNQDQARKLPEGKSGRSDCAPCEKDARPYNPVWQSLATRGVFVQPKLSVSASDDPQEREADHIAERVTRARNAMEREPSARAGRIRYLIPPYPDGGSHLSVTAKIKIRIRPTQ